MSPGAIGGPRQVADSIEEPTAVAALYVRADTVYRGLPGVEVWDEARDATGYAGPWPVVAHPPCACWGRLRHFARQPTRHLGPLAVDQVRRWGGVLEHPAGSLLWPECGLPLPGEAPDAWGGFSVRVTQGDFGHPAPKNTWLYVVRTWLPPGPPKSAPAAGRVCSLSRRGREATPAALATWLVQGAARAVPCE